MNYRLTSPSFQIPSPLISKGGTGGTPIRKRLSSGGQSFIDAPRPPAPIRIVLRSAFHNLERVGPILPIQVEEVFAVQERKSPLSGKVTDCGYVFLICGRSLFIWEFESKNSQVPINALRFPHCHSLCLPPSAIAYTADLISVFFPKPDADYPSCIAVSPEGYVRFWPDIASARTSYDTRIDLNGEECAAIANVGSIGCVFLTTSSSAMYIEYVKDKKGDLVHRPGLGVLNYRPLKLPESWLGRIGKRVTSIFFGPMTSDQGNETRVNKILVQRNIQQVFNIFLLSGVHLQKWTIIENTPDNLNWTTDLGDGLKEAFKSYLTHWDGCELTDIDCWILDMHPDKEGILMLCAAFNNLTPQIYYALVSFPVNSSEPPTRVKDFLLLKFINAFKPNDSSVEALNYKFILCGTTAYIYNNKSITIIKPEEDPDILEFRNTIDHIFSGWPCLNLPTFFSRRHGLVAVIPRDTDLSATASSSIVLNTSISDQNITIEKHNLSIYHINPHELEQALQDTEGQLKAAFIFHVKNQLSQCYEIVNTLCPADEPVLASIDGPIDTAIANIAKFMLDDIPAGDPRWKQNSEHGGTGSKHYGGFASSHAMLVIQQLKDKQHALGLYLNYLKDSGIWNRLTAITVRNRPMATVHYLSELAEKVFTAIVLKTLRDKISGCIFEDAVDRTAAHFNTEISKGLSGMDVFFREVSRVDELFYYLSVCCEVAAHTGVESKLLIRKISEGNIIIGTCLTEVIQYRIQTADAFYLNDIARNMNLDYVPWTIADGLYGIFESLLRQHSVTLNYGLEITSEKPLWESVLEQYVILSDCILDSRKMRLTMVPKEREDAMYTQFCNDRHNIIIPIVDLNEPEKALLLAEKYLDFETLIIVCDTYKKHDRLNEYMRRFRDTNFAQVVYNWYMKNGQTHKVLRRYSKANGLVPEGADKLRKYLIAYPALSWIPFIVDREYSFVAETLRLQALNEKRSVARQKTMLSISKLAKITAPATIDTTNHLDDINKRLKLIAFQERIPDYVLQKHGFDPYAQEVFHPRIISTLFTSSEYVDATEMDFQIALDVAEFIDDESEKVDVVLHIWRAALLRDSWDFPNLDQPLDLLPQTLFFRLLDFSIALGYDPNSLLPPIEMLLDDPSLDTFKENDIFYTLLKIGYEHFHRTQILE